MLADDPEKVELKQIISSTRVIIAPERFAYLSAERHPNSGNHVMCFSYGDDKTVVARESRVLEIDHVSIECWFRLIEFRIPTPFEAPGFLASIASAVAAEQINLLIISTFPRDYVLVRDHDLRRATDALQGLGFTIETIP